MVFAPGSTWVLEQRLPCPRRDHAVLQTLQQPGGETWAPGSEHSAGWWRWCRQAWRSGWLPNVPAWQGTLVGAGQARWDRLKMLSI